jgi:rod shape-determining protein MreD
MFARRFFISLPIFTLIYILQESVVTQFKLFGGGFSLFLIFALLWSALGTPEMGALTGFGAGLLMDLSQSASGPMGQWTLIMILAGFAVSYLGYGDDNFRGNPISLVFTVAAAVVVIRIDLLNSRTLPGQRYRQHLVGFSLALLICFLVSSTCTATATCCYQNS